MLGLDFPTIGWIVLALSALVVGIAKTSIGGMGALAVAGFALFIPAKESTAAVLLVLIIGDVVAVSTYRRSADWAMLRRLLPAVLPGIVLGALLMLVVDDTTMTIVIGLSILAALALQLALRHRPAPPPDVEPHLAATVGAGVAAGFTTMVANAADPVMALYLLAARVDKMRFVGTNAWFFLLVNVAKLPFSAGLGLLPASTLVLTAVLAPTVLVDTWLGRRLLRRLSQQMFEGLTLAASLVAAIVLLASALV
ncbi:sulfite exporter TauE/SafE family protein [Miniimonas sp. S16]|uniref:sulfite exporter TauE/SafE family protein n=1 Tax=Miniimonas sp. S16 TaxID=2171623 RepID=UPI001F405061|nr:sulfite exporter TauE/SafE family protein [Miniimonas sp. S16]